MLNIKFHKNYHFLIILLVFTTFSFAKHEEYYSLTNIQYKESEKNLQINMRLFIDDIEFALRNQTGQAIELGTDRETNDIDKIIKVYIAQKFYLKIANKKLTYHFVGKEVDADYLHIYLEINNIEPFDEIEITNKVLMETFPSQENIVKIKAFGVYKNGVLNQLNPTKQYFFKN